MILMALKKQAEESNILIGLDCYESLEKGPMEGTEADDERDFDCPYYMYSADIGLTKTE